MKKVILVSKTHLDLGFTGFASEILDAYTNNYIPNAIKMGKELNQDGKKFVWTVGSWLLKKVLENGTAEQQKALHDACMRGDIVAHAMPFTTHSELMDEELLEYSLSIIKELDEKFHRKTIAAKMTDVPGHTIALVPKLAKIGIKLIHIGVNGASAMPIVPECFLWRYQGSEIIVIYGGGYGGEYRSGVIDDILYFDHSLDNHGPRYKYNAIHAKYPNYEVIAGTLDDYAELLWEVKDRLPVVTSEIGDSWIHGVGTDPYKVTKMRELMRLKKAWLQEGKLVRGTAEYSEFMDNLLCVAEHTWGLNANRSLRDYDNYLRKDFDEARRLDIKIKRRGIFKCKCFKKLAMKGETGRYKVLENSWQEQREYLDFAIACLSQDKRNQVEACLKEITPIGYSQLKGEVYRANTKVSVGDWELSVNSNGGIASLKHKGEEVLLASDKGILEYRSYGNADYDYWLNHYTRNYYTTRVWSVGDFAMPNLKSVDKKYKQGRFSYSMTDARISHDDDISKLIVKLSTDEYCHNSLGASQNAEVVYTLSCKGLNVELIYCDKPANRLPEATFFKLYPNANKSNLRYVKIGEVVDPYDVVKSGNRNNSCVEKVVYGKYEIENIHAPLISLGRGKILEFDNVLEDVELEGISYILNNNVWGTNFPLWNEGNGYFKFIIKEAKI